MQSNFLDATSVGNDGDDFGTTTSVQGIINDGREFNNPLDYIEIGTNYWTPGFGTVEVWRDVHV